MIPSQNVEGATRASGVCLVPFLCLFFGERAFALRCCAAARCKAGEREFAFEKLRSRIKINLSLRAGVLYVLK
jgi:hypothetical protein